MESKTPDLSHAMAGKPGSIKSWLQFVSKPKSFLTNPAILAGAAGIMAQLAMQQAMDEITDYLATINEKVDDILRAQKDAVLSEMIGVGFVIDEAMIIREHVGRVSEITWSKVQATSTTIARTQAYALRQLDALAEKMDHKTKIGDRAKASKEAAPKVREWLAVLARCFQLQDAIAVLELDRVLDASPDELDRHRLGLRAARQKRLELVTRCTGRLTARMDASVATVDSKVVIMHPLASRAMVDTGNHVAAGVAEFHQRLGVGSARQSLEAKRWVDAVAEVKDDVLDAGGKGVTAARNLGNEALNRVRSAKHVFPSGTAERKPRQSGDGE